MKKKFVTAILGTMLAFGHGLFNPTPTFAETETVEADGEYIMGDGPEENQGVAKERARKEAMRNASEKICVWVESFSEAIDGELTRDEIRTISAAVLEVLSSHIQPTVEGETVKYICHIIVTVEKDNVLNYIHNGKGQIDEATRRNKELEEENARIKAELKELKERYALASADERTEIKKAVKRNEEKFTALQYTEQDEKYYTKRDYKKAIEALQKALELNPDYANAWAWLAAVYNDFGNSDKAIAYNEKAIALDPNNALAWNNVGVSYSYRGNEKKAIEYYEKARELDPKLMYPWSNLGRIYASNGDFDKAIEYCRQAIESNPIPIILIRGLVSAKFMPIRVNTKSLWTATKRQ